MDAAPSLSPYSVAHLFLRMRLDGDLLAAIDAMAYKRGTSRNAIISYWCSKGVESE